MIFELWMHKNVFAAGCLPQDLLGDITALPQTLAG